MGFSSELKIALYLNLISKNMSNYIMIDEEHKNQPLLGLQQNKFMYQH